MSTAEILRILYKYYGGIDWFYDKPVFLLLECINHGIEKELEIPKIIRKVLNKEPTFEEKKQMRSKEEIMRDYGLEEV